MSEDVSYTTTSHMQCGKWALILKREINVSAFLDFRRYINGLHALLTPVPLLWLLQFSWALLNGNEVLWLGSFQLFFCYQGSVQIESTPSSSYIENSIPNSRVEGWEPRKETWGSAFIRSHCHHRHRFLRQACCTLISFCSLNFLFIIPSTCHIRA